MPVSIIEALPSVHGSLLGIGFSLFGAYAIYAYQKLAESNELLQEILEEAKRFSFARMYQGVPAATVLGDDGVLDWVKVEGALRDASLLTGNVAGMTDLKDFKRLDADKVKTVYEEIIQLMNYFFISYPFNGDSLVDTGPITKVVREAKGKPFDVERVKLMALYIRRLQINWNSYHEDYIHLARQYFTCREYEKRADIERAVIEGVNKIPGLSARERQDRIEASVKPSGQIADVNEYARALTDFFNRVSVFGNEFLPRIQKIIDINANYKTRFKFKVLSRFAMAFFAVVFIFGIVLPLVLSDVNLGGAWWWVGYMLFFVSAVPYLMVWGYLWRKISKTDF